MKSENHYDLVLLVLKYFVHYQMKNKMGQLAFFSLFFMFMQPWDPFLSISWIFLTLTGIIALTLSQNVSDIQKQIWLLLLCCACRPWKRCKFFSLLLSFGQLSGGRCKHRPITVSPFEYICGLRFHVVHCVYAYLLT